MKTNTYCRRLGRQTLSGWRDRSDPDVAIKAYGFITGHCTQYAALDTIARVTTQVDIKDIPLNISLDLSKAFDYLDHAILLNKLKYYGVVGTPLQLLKSYLTDRNRYLYKSITHNPTFYT